MMKKYVVVDIETTGSASKKDDEIIQLAAVVIENGKITNSYSTFIHTEVVIPPFITELTGITNEMIIDAPSFSVVMKEFIPLLKNAYFVAHNVNFDWNFLQDQLQKFGFESVYCPLIDTVEFARIMLPTADSYSLNELAQRFDFSHDRPHQADSDALVTAEIFLFLIEKLNKLPLVTLQSLQKLSYYFQSDIKDILSEVIINKMLKILDDEKQFDIFSGFALKKREYLFQFQENHSIDFRNYLEDSSIDDADFPYEKREGQFQMMENIYDSFERSENMMIEAGTGIGKSLGYLLPSIFYAKKYEKPVLISTKTTQLQHQLMEKELPKLKEILPFSFEMTILKGKNHYLSLQKFEQVLQENDINYDTILTKASILVWLTETVSGDVDELNLSSGGNLLWRKICCDYDELLKNRDKWYSRCFYQQALNKLIISDVVITNHALLLQDKSNLFTSYDYVVIDEAHTFEETARSTLGTKIHGKNVQYLLNRLSEIMSQSVYTSGLKQIVDDLKFQTDEFFRMFHRYIMGKQEYYYTNKFQYLLNSANEPQREWQIISEVASKLLDSFKKFHTECEAIEIENVPSEWGYIVEKLNVIQDSLKYLLFTKDKDGVTTIEIDVKGTFHSFYMSRELISVSEFLQKNFFDKRKSVVLTSATLSINNDFTYMKELLGIKESKEKVIPSPFQYKDSVEMYIPTDIVNVKQVNSEQFVDDIARSIVQFAEVTEGRMLVLFTSQQMLNETYSLVKSYDQMRGFNILAQGISNGSRMRLIKQFQRLKKSILFGTSSFWEGVDIPGEDLQCLVIVKLPFTPPDTPFNIAKVQKFDELGKNPFYEFMLPQAVLRFKQGFGRLIRSKSDKGIVVVLDKRIISSNYGQIFIDALPKIIVHKELIEDSLERLKKI